MVAPKKKIIKGKGGIEGKKKRSKKDPNAPKRALSAYMFFAQEKRKEIVSAHPNLQKDVATVSKMIGESWNKLDEKQKVPFDKKSSLDKARYEKEKAAYLKKKA